MTRCSTVPSYGPVPVRRCRPTAAFRARPTKLPTVTPCPRTVRIPGTPCSSRYHEALAFLTPSRVRNAATGSRIPCSSPSGHPWADATGYRAACLPGSTPPAEGVDVDASSWPSRAVEVRAARRVEVVGGQRGVGHGVGRVHGKDCPPCVGGSVDVAAHHLGEPVEQHGGRHLGREAACLLCERSAELDLAVGQGCIGRSLLEAGILRPRRREVAQRSRAGVVRPSWSTMARALMQTAPAPSRGRRSGRFRVP